MMDAIESEDALSSEVLGFFRSMLDASDFREQVEVQEKRQVIMNLTIGRDGKSGHWQYYLGLQQQDIVFYLRDEEDAIPLMPPPARYHWTSTDQTTAGRVRVPLLICELKVNKGLTTHQLITYSKIAEQIRDVHPYCAYFFVIGGTPHRTLMPETVLRQAKGFNRVFLDWMHEKAIIWRDVESHLTYLRDRVKVIPAGRHSP